MRRIFIYQCFSIRFILYFELTSSDSDSDDDDSEGEAAP